MSGFNEFLVEDRSMNRLVSRHLFASGCTVTTLNNVVYMQLDSFTLWKTICASTILANVTFILMLNKCDILRAKLEAGHSFAKWVRSYKDGPNDVAHVSECK